MPGWMDLVPIAPAEKKISWACRHGHGAWQRRHGHSAVCVSFLVSLLRTEFLRGHGDGMEVFLFIAAGSRCTLVSMNKRRAGRPINNERAELKLEAVFGRARVCVFNLLNSEAARRTSGEHWLYFSLESTLVFKDAEWKITSLEVCNSIAQVQCSGTTWRFLYTSTPLHFSGKYLYSHKFILRLLPPLTTLHVRLKTQFPFCSVMNPCSMPRSQSFAITHEWMKTTLFYIKYTCKEKLQDLLPPPFLRSQCTCLTSQSITGDCNGFKARHRRDIRGLLLEHLYRFTVKR